MIAPDPAEVEDAMRRGWDRPTGEAASMYRQIKVPAGDRLGWFDRANDGLWGALLSLRWAREYRLNPDGVTYFRPRERLYRQLHDAAGYRRHAAINLSLGRRP